MSYSSSSVRYLDRGAESMTPQRFRQIHNVFDALMEREPATRAMFPEEACQRDEELRSEVRRLIAAQRAGRAIPR